MVGTAVNSDDLDLRTARANYWADNHFGDDGGASLRWVTVKVLGIPLMIPNTAGRKRAVRVHDLHHVVTGYATDLVGEAEISAWELATGCIRLPAALVLNLLSMGLFAPFAPQRVLRAWVRGRHTRNLYREPYNDQLLARSVAATRADLGLTRLHRTRWSDAVTFALTWIASLPALLVAASPVIAVVVAAFWLW